MDRRTLLRRAAALGAIGLAGCTGSGSPPDGGGTTPEDTPTPSPAPPTTEPIEVDTVDFEVTDATGDAEPTANAEFDTDANEIRFTGIIQGKNGCQTAALETIEYDRESDEVTLAVKTKKRDDAGDACTEQIIYISYEATVTFTGGLPSTVSVSHDGDGIMSGAHDSASASAPDPDGDGE